MYIYSYIFINYILFFVTVIKIKEIVFLFHFATERQNHNLGFDIHSYLQNILINICLLLPYDVQSFLIHYPYIGLCVKVKIYKC